MHQIEWNTDNDVIGASNVGLQYLQAFLVVYLHTLRDVENDLRNIRQSPLAKLIEASAIADAEQAGLIAISKRTIPSKHPQPFGRFATSIIS